MQSKLSNEDWSTILRAAYDAARRIGASVEDAADLASDAIVRLLERGPSVRDPQAFVAHCAANRARDLRRDTATRASILLDVARERSNVFSDDPLETLCARDSVLGS